MLPYIYEAIFDSHVNAGGTTVISLIDDVTVYQYAYINILPHQSTLTSFHILAISTNCFKYEVGDNKDLF